MPDEWGREQCGVHATARRGRTMFANHLRSTAVPGAGPPWGMKLAIAFSADSAGRRYHADLAEDGLVVGPGDVIEPR